jgi:hypothetical protein
MKKEGRELVKEALQDVQSLKEAAVESAKKQLVEELTPSIRKFLDEKIGGLRTLNGKVATGEERAQSRNPADPDGEARAEESVDLTLEDALQEFTDQESHKMKSSKKSSKKEGLELEAKSSKKSSAKSSKKSSFKNEEIELSEAELARVYDAALKTEVNVKKGFNDVSNFVELNGKSPDVDKAAPEPPTGKKAGEHHFEEEVPPHKQSWIPENKDLKAMIQRGLEENKQLRENLRKAVALCETLGKQLHQVNLFNSKVLHVNKVLNSGMRLTKEQRNFVLESIDKARSTSEVKIVFEALIGTLKTAAQLSESRNPRPPKANAQGARTSGTPKQEVLSESVDKAQNTDLFARQRELAGIVK